MQYEYETQFEEYRQAPLWKKLQMRVMWYVLNALEVDPIPKPWEVK